MKHKVQYIHMVGIGGSGMSGIAEVLLNLGYKVSGSDMSESTVVQHLRSRGATIFQGHNASNITNAQVLVKSTAITEENEEVIAARKTGIPVIPRAEMLAELMRLKTGIAIAGTHGKTTTTSLLASIFDAAQFDPTVIIGGKLNAYGTNARLGDGQYLIAEADESDGSFLCLVPIITIVTNVDLDHIDFYANLQAVDAAFIQFMNKIPFYGINIVCGDDAGIQRLLPSIKRPVLTYGFGKENTIQGKLNDCGYNSHFSVRYKGEDLGLFTLTHPGQHNVLNALAAIGVALEAGIDLEHIKKGLESFAGVGRRFEKKGVKHGVDIIDDYAHHPVEIAATLAAAKQCFPGRRILAAFQPHRFSRTQALFGEFCKTFDTIDRLFLSNIYPASEKPIPGVSGASLAQGIQQVSDVHVTYHPDFKDMLQAMAKEIKPNDIVLTLGAGNITTLGPQLLEMEWECCK